MRSDAPTVEEYLRELPLERAEALGVLRSMILDAYTGIQEMIEYGHPHHNLHGSLFALASQKHYMTQYIGIPTLVQKYKDHFGRSNAGKNSVRFRKLNDLEIPVIEELIKEAVNTRREAIADQRIGEKT